MLFLHLMLVTSIHHRHHLLLLLVQLVIRLASHSSNLTSNFDLMLMLYLSRCRYVLKLSLLLRMPNVRSAHHWAHHHAASCLILVLSCWHVIALNIVWFEKHRDLFLLVVSYQASFKWWHPGCPRISLMILLLLH